MNIGFVTARFFAAAALVILMYGFIIPSVGFHGKLERIEDGKIDNIPSYVYPLWNFYQKGRYSNLNIPKEVKNDLRKMIESSEEIGVASSPVWSFSLEAPNYPKEVFPLGLPVFIHFDGLSGEIQEMDTINHYVGMARMERGGPYERALAPYALIITALILVLFILYDKKWINYLVVIPILLPFLFIGIYFYWLYWFGHNLHMGAIKIESFMPVILGDGKVAQFTTHAYPAIGFWLLVAVSLFSFLALWLRKRAPRYQPAKRVMVVQHLLMLTVLLMSVGGFIYLAKIDREVDTLGRIAYIVEKSRVKVPLEAKVPELTIMEKEAIKKEMEAQRKEKDLKVKVLEKRVGRITKFKISALYKRNCAPCHGVSDGGSIGPTLIGLSKDKVLKKLVEYKRSEEAMHIVVIEHLPDEDIEKLAREIAQFKAKGR